MKPETWRLRRRILAALLSGGLLLLSFPPVDLRFAAWAALVPLAMALRGATGRAGALCGFLAGLVFFGGLLYWIADFGAIAWAPLVVVLSVTWGLLGWFGSWASGRALGRVLGVPLLFVGLEILRSRFPFGGFAWGLLGTSQHDGLPLLPLARAGGVYLVSLAVVFLNACIADVLGRGRVVRRGAVAVLAGAVGFLPSLLPLGLAGPPTGDLEVASVQVRVGERTFGPTRATRVGPEDIAILEDFLRVSEGLVFDPPDLVIWPENALDRDPFTNPDLGERVAETVRFVAAPFLIGAILDAPGDRFRNSLLLYDEAGVAVRRYDKQKLVPFGEYVPISALRGEISALDQVPQDGLPGRVPVVFDVGGARVGGVICFESTFPDLVRGMVDAGAQVLVVATNNASFGRTMASREHLAQSQLRAVEHGRAIVHAAISGISAIVDPDGTVRERTRLYREDVIRDVLPLTSSKTPYGIYGEAIEAGFAVLALAVAAGGTLGVVARRRERRETKAAGEFDWGPAVPMVPPEPAVPPEAVPMVPPEPAVPPEAST